MWSVTVIDPLLASIAAVAVAVLFAHAAVVKLGDPALFEQHLAAYGVPHGLLAVATRAVPALEALAAMLLLTPPLRTPGALLAAALLVVYAAAMATNLWRGHALDCGCGGPALPVSWALVARNAALAGLALAAAAPPSARMMGHADFAVLAAAVALASLLYAAFNQVLRHRSGPSEERSSWMH